MTGTGAEGLTVPLPAMQPKAGEMVEASESMRNSAPEMLGLTLGLQMSVINAFHHSLVVRFLS